MKVHPFADKGRTSCVLKLIIPVGEHQRSAVGGERALVEVEQAFAGEAKVEGGTQWQPLKELSYQVGRKRELRQSFTFRGRQLTGLGLGVLNSAKAKGKDRDKFGVKLIGGSGGGCAWDVVIITLITLSSNSSSSN